MSCLIIFIIVYNFYDTSINSNRLSKQSKRDQTRVIDDILGLSTCLHFLHLKWDRYIFGAEKKESEDAECKQVEHIYY